MLQNFDAQKTIWVEDESHTIGTVFIPSEFYYNYRKSPLYVLDISFEERLNHLMTIYGNYNVQEIKEAYERIGKKLGGQNVKLALEMIDNDDLVSAASIALIYYDKAYSYGLQNKDTQDITYFPFKKFNAQKIAQKLLEKA